jgi:thiamine kinase-like enzyme
VFTHGDLHISNILVRPRPSPTPTANADDDELTPGSSTTGWKIVALLDWECAGWYPEHWEYVKILSSVKWRSDWAARAQHLLGRHFDEEFLMDNRMRLRLVA